MFTTLACDLEKHRKPWATSAASWLLENQRCLPGNGVMGKISLCNCSVSILGLQSDFSLLSFCSTVVTFKLNTDRYTALVYLMQRYCKV